MTSILKYLDSVRERVDMATPGPWLNGYPNACKITPMPDHVWSINKDLIAREVMECDAPFIAASRTDCDRLERCMRIAMVALDKAIGCISVQQLAHIQQVKQLDGSIKSELVPTYCGDIYTELSAKRNEISQILEADDGQK